MKPVRTVIVDDNATFLESISSFLGRRETVDVVGVARSADEALNLVEGRGPGLALVDLVMPKMGGLELTKRLKALTDPPCVIILTLADHPAYEEQARAAGADGLLSKYEVTNRLIPMIVKLCGDP